MPSDGQKIQKKRKRRKPLPLLHFTGNCFPSYRTKCVDENRFQALKIKG